MADEISVIKVFNNEIEASMAQQVLEDSGIKAFLQKDDAGGMEPQLQLTNGVSLIVNKDNEERAAELIREFETAKSATD